ncbi:diaminopimelate epimerase [Streptomyces sp. PSRA5]
MRFRKIHGAGNDFVLVTGAADERDWRAWGPRLCARSTGVGADGLVVSAVAGKDPAVLDVLCVNPDGSIAALCANALRCVAWCASREHGWVTMRLMMAGVPHEAVVDGTHVRVTVEAGEVEPERIVETWHGGTVRFDAVCVGAKHLVALVDDVERLDVAGLVRQVRDRGAAAGANVSVVQRLDSRQLAIRTYEHGAEGEALSCASGAVAAGVVATRSGLADVARPVTVHNRAGMPLTVTAHPEHPAYWVGGPVTHVFDGEVELT